MKSHLFSAYQRVTVYTSFVYAALLPFMLHAQDATSASLQTAMAPSVSAPAPISDDLIQQAVTSLLPSNYVIYAPLIILLIAGLGRGIRALQNGRGLVGWFHSLFYGDNTPKVPLLLACLCLLSLSSCAGVMTALANPAVDSAVISLADLGIDELAAKGVIKPGQTVEIKQATAVITDPNDSTLNKVVKLADVGLDAAVAAGKLNPGDSLLIQKGTAIIQSALTPAPKQPVNVTPPVAAPATTTTSQRPVPHLPGCLQLASTPLRHTANDVQGEPALPLRGSKVMKQSGVSIPLFGAAVAADLASR